MHQTLTLGNGGEGSSGCGTGSVQKACSGPTWIHFRTQAGWSVCGSQGEQGHTWG